MFNDDQNTFFNTVTTMPDWYYIAHPWARPASSTVVVPNKPKFVHKELTVGEAKCYWKNYPAAANSMEASGISLDSEAASFSYNYFGDQGEIRNLQCPPEDKVLTVDEANCYW